MHQLLGSIHSDKLFYQYIIAIQAPRAENI